MGEREEKQTNERFACGKMWPAECERSVEEEEEEGSRGKGVERGVGSRK